MKNLRTDRVSRRHALGLLSTLIGAALAVALPAPATAQQQKLRISLDTNPSHVRNKGVEKFAEELKKRTGDRFAIEIYPSAQLFRDRDVPRALRQGAVEMAVPGTWQLDGVEPDAALQTLPMFYGISGEVAHKVMDGKLGEFLSKRLEERMRVKIPGPWFDLGHQLFFSVAKPLNTFDDLKGLKVRSPGGSANAARFKAMGATAMLIPFPDLPLALSQGVVDVVATTYESAFTSKLHESGLKYAFEDHQLFAQYVPMIGRAFWDKQPKEVQQAITEAWAVAAQGQREEAAKAQAHARDELIRLGLKAVIAPEDAIVAMRKHLMTTQEGLVAEMKIDRETIDTAMKELAAAGVVF